MGVTNCNLNIMQAIDDLMNSLTILLEVGNKYEFCTLL